MPLSISRAFCVLALGSILASACGDGASSRSVDRAHVPVARPATLVVTEAAGIRTIRNEVEAIGTARANESVTITAKVTDTVSRVNFDDSGLVEQGDVLIELANREESALLAEAEANLQEARTQLERLENLLEQRTVPVSQVDEARSRFAAAEARYQSVVARLADRLIRAPFSGLLGFRRVSAGTLITPGTPITTVDDVSVIKLDFSIPETYLRLLRPGMALAAQSVAYPDHTFEATVRNIDSRVDPVTRAATVRALIDNDELLLRPGMLLTVKLVTAERDALMVPEDALVQRGDQVFVYTVHEGVADTRDVRHGDRYDGWVEIVRGLDLGEEVVTEGIVKIRPGARVRVSDPYAGPAGTADPGR